MAGPGRNEADRLREAWVVFVCVQVARRLDDTGCGGVDVMLLMATLPMCRLRGWTHRW